MADAEEKRISRNEQRKRNYQYYKKLNRCVICHKQDAYTLNGRARCAECAEYDCGQHKKSGYAKANERLKSYRDAWRAKGICIRCGKSPAVSGKSYCGVCAEYTNRYKKNRRIESGINYPRGDNGFCWQCNKRPDEDGMKVCKECYALYADTWFKGRDKYLEEYGAVWHGYGFPQKQK